MGESITQEKELTIQVTGSGNTKAKALSEAFAGIKKAVGGTPLRIEPLEVTVLEAVETQYTERFLFLFFKRTRSSFQLKLDVRVRVYLINLDEIPFAVRRDKSLFR